ncbi:MAG: PIG-L family deacetylase [Verrucomicrobiota bacterium]
MQNPYLTYVKDIERALENARDLSVSGKRGLQKSESKALLFSPHPDDECIQGLLPLRLQRELNFQIINVPVTFGSNKDRRTERAEELENACAFLGWHCHTHRSDLRDLETSEVYEIIDHYKPKAIFLPHARDWNLRHISTHKTVMEAIDGYPDLSCWIIETEYWGQMENPNTMVASSREHLAELIAATSFHIGEVSRNPYHLTLPAWMQDNVRRGTERILGQGQRAPNYTFATLYKAHYRKNQKIETSTLLPQQIDLEKPLQFPVKIDS